MRYCASTTVPRASTLRGVSASASSIESTDPMDSSVAAADSDPSEPIGVTLVLQPRLRMIGGSSGRGDVKLFLHRHPPEGQRKNRFTRLIRAARSLGNGDKMVPSMS